MSDAGASTSETPPHPPQPPVHNPPSTTTTRSPPVRQASATRPPPVHSSCGPSTASPALHRRRLTASANQTRSPPEPSVSPTTSQRPPLLTLRLPCTTPCALFPPTLSRQTVPWRVLSRGGFRGPTAVCSRSSHSSPPGISSALRPHLGRIWSRISAASRPHLGQQRRPNHCQCATESVTIECGDRRAPSA